MFSTSAICIVFSSSAVRMYAGTVSSPALCEALQRRSPAIIWYVPSPMFLSVTGCTIPSSFIESASSSSARSLKSRLGWLGFGTIWLMGISPIDELPEVFTSPVAISASSPRPKT